MVINVGTGGWLIQHYSDDGSVTTLCGQPTQEAARDWIDRHLQQTNQGVSRGTTDQNLS